MGNIMPHRIIAAKVSKSGSIIKGQCKQYVYNGSGLQTKPVLNCFNRCFTDQQKPEKEV